MNDITLLDYFAAKALPSVLNAGPLEMVAPEEIAAVAYHIADAMIKEKLRRIAEVNKYKK